MLYNMTTSTGIISNFLENRIAQKALGGPDTGGGVYIPPEDLFVTVYGSINGAEDADTGYEITDGYIPPHARAAFGDILIDNYTLSNSEIINFDETQVDWGTVYGWGLKDSSAGGNLLFWGLFDASIDIPIGQSLRIDAGNLAIKFASPNTTYGGWTSFSANEMLKWFANVGSFDWTVSGTSLALGNNVIVNNTTDNIFSSWTEISTNGTGYTRQLIPRDAWTVPSDGICKNANQIIFTSVATANWGVVSDVVLYDTVDGTHPLFWGHLTTPVTINAGDGFKIATWGLQIQFS
jgi:hypothetical protein